MIRWIIDFILGSVLGKLLGFAERRLDEAQDDKANRDLGAAQQRETDLKARVESAREADAIRQAQRDKAAKIDDDSAFNPEDFRD